MELTRDNIKKMTPEQLDKAARAGELRHLGIGGDMTRCQEKPLAADHEVRKLPC